MAAAALQQGARLFAPVVAVLPLAVVLAPEPQLCHLLVPLLPVSGNPETRHLLSPEHSLKVLLPPVLDRVLLAVLQRVLQLCRPPVIDRGLRVAGPPLSWVLPLPCLGAV